MTTDIKEPADWSDLPRDMYVTHVKVYDGFGWEVKMCNVPMITVPEVRYVRADALEAMAGEVDRLKGQNIAWADKYGDTQNAMYAALDERDRLKAALRLWQDAWATGRNEPMAIAANATKNELGGDAS